MIAQGQGLIPFSTLELAIIVAYLLVLIVIGALGYAARKENSLRDFYLAGPGIGFFVLLLTLYATQYSGNTLIGFTGKTYKVGYAWTVSVHFMTAIVAFYLLFAPKLYPIAKKHGFITPADFIQHRFGSTGLTILSSLIMIVGVANFLVGQLMAMGRALQGLTDFDPFIAYVCGVVFLALIVVGYETLGGFRAVVWTDAVQGCILAIGFLVLLWMVTKNFGSLEEATQKLLAGDREKMASAEDPNAVATMAHPPNHIQSLNWLSYILAVGIGAALYPQAIQRIYAARRARNLKRSLAVMAFLPLATTLVSLVVGVIAAAEITGIEAGQSDTVLAEVCRRIQEDSQFGRILVAVLFAAIIAALMSTADSILLSISSMFTKDIVNRVSRKPWTQESLTRFGKLFSWGVMLIAILVAIELQRIGKANLVSLLDRKFDLLVQLAPAFMVGVHWRGLQTKPVLAGVIVGLVVALSISTFGPTDKPYGVHAGLYGLAANLVVACGGSLLLIPTGESSPARRDSGTAKTEEATG